MHTPGIIPAQHIMFLERRGEQTLAHDALILSISMQEQLAGTNGEPAIEVIFLHPDRLRYAGTSDYREAVVRFIDVVHSSHANWINGAASVCYQETDGFAPVPAPLDLATVAARTVHEANRILCLMLGDTSQPTWAKAPEWQQSSSYAGIKQIEANPATTPAESHASWMAQKIADGWVWGAVKDTEKKTHPCIVPYDQLPAGQQMKDWMFGAVARGVLDLPQHDTEQATPQAEPIEQPAAETPIEQPVAT